MHIFRTLRNSINLNASHLKGTQLNTVANKFTKSKTQTQKDERIFSLIRNNKIAFFIITFAITNLLLSFKPNHKSRPDILARNRLESRK